MTADVDISVIVPLRDQEKRVAAIVRNAAKLPHHLPRHDLPGPEAGQAGWRMEILALDERSGDNTLSVLSLLHAQLPELRTLQDVERGAGIRRGARVARGDTWLVLDREVDLHLAGWGVGQVLRGQRAAIVPGEILALDRALGITVLPTVTGGLMSAQRAVTRYLRGQDTQPAWSPAPDRGPMSRARLALRGRLVRVGLPWLDRPSS